MKIFKLFPLACAALMMCACSSDDASNGGSTGVNEPQYLSVNIVNVGATPTGRGTDTDYEDGTKEENEIAKFASTSSMVTVRLILLRLLLGLMV